MLNVLPIELNEIYEKQMKWNNLSTWHTPSEKGQG